MIIQATEIQNLARDEPLISKLFDYLGGRQRHAREITIDRAMKAVPGEARSEMVRAFRLIGQVGLGDLLMGRKGKKTRLSWLVSPSDIERAVRGDVAEVISLGGNDSVISEDDDEDEDLVTHEYRLRRDLVVSIELPEDLTPKEASRLSQWLLTVPFDE